MKKSIARKAGISVLAAISLLGLAATFDFYQEADKIWPWTKPAPYPPPLLAGMNLDTISVMLDSGNLQWYEPRPEPGQWDAVEVMKIHASPEQAWKVFVDYEGQCSIMNKTFVYCKTEWRKGNQVRNRYKIRTSVLDFSMTFDMVDQVLEEPPFHQNIRTVEGGLEGRVVDIRLIPIANHTQTIVFMRYYACMKSLGYSMQAVLKVVPMAEWPVTAGSANYHLRTHRNQIEKLAGYNPPANLPPLNYSALDVPTLRRLPPANTGLIRETRQGKTINGEAFAFIAAPAAVVWSIISDLDHYDLYFPNQKTVVEKKNGNQVLVRQNVESQSVLVFTFAYELHALYTLEPPFRVSYRAIDGTWQGSMGGYYILPADHGKNCVLFCTMGFDLERDTSLTSRIIRSGDYPFNNVMNLLAALTSLQNIKPFAEKKARAQK